MKMNLNLVQTQKLIMTPELKQAIEILQYNSVELNDFIKEELLNNPVLQKQDDEPKEGESKPVSESTETSDVPETQGAVEDHPYGDRYEPVGIDWREIPRDDGYDKHRYEGEFKDDREDLSYDNLIASEETLTDHLLQQLQFSQLEEEDMPVAQYMIENIDTNGYLEVKAEDIANRFKIEIDDVEQILAVVQSFDPPGIGARDLRECLLIQARQKYEGDLLLVKVIEDYLTDLASNRLQNIAKALHVNSADVQEAFDRIKSLEPKPGGLYASLRDVRYITPDVYVEKIDGEYVVTITETTAPKLFVSNFYRSLLEQGVNDQASEYIQKKLNSAFKLIKSIEQRRNTIYRVVKAIVDYQIEFFDKGPAYLRTLNLKDIAFEVGIHESTVSRAVNGKYLQCRLGLFEIKYFFQSGVSSDAGDGISSESIKMAIKELIDNEDHKSPISDQDISDELNKMGIRISRRTIAKYRDELNIPSSSKRKRY